MRHGNGLKKLNRSSTHRRATLRNMVTALFTHGRIETTHIKAKALRPVAEKLITLGKRGDLHARRLAAAYLTDADAVKTLFSDIAERMRTRAGGYTRVLRVGMRRGDNATAAIIELVDHDVKKAAAAKA
ncbi:MAG: 50S ribosomal protein L17 [Myxococcota bacterium]|nr:50S ribosomal protein L17 [Myxococcota bacterium]